jgi:hypothetical protein
MWYRGAHTGCSCGFTYGQVPPAVQRDETEEAAGRASVAALRQYLLEAVERLGDVELFSSWKGDWHLEPEQRLEVTPEWFGGDSFDPPEKILFRVKRPTLG